MPIRAERVTQSRAESLRHVVVAAEGLAEAETRRIRRIGKADVVGERECSREAVRDVVIAAAVQFEPRGVREIEIERETAERTFEPAAIDVALAPIAQQAHAIAEAFL